MAKGFFFKRYLKIRLLGIQTFIVQKKIRKNCRFKAPSPQEIIGPLSPFSTQQKIRQRRFWQIKVFFGFSRPLLLGVKERGVPKFCKSGSSSPFMTFELTFNFSDEFPTINNEDGFERSALFSCFQTLNLTNDLYT